MLRGRGVDEGIGIYEDANDAQVKKTDSNALRCDTLTNETQSVSSRIYNLRLMLIRYVFQEKHLVVAALVALAQRITTKVVTKYSSKSNLVKLTPSQPSPNATMVLSNLP